MARGGASAPASAPPGRRRRSPVRRLVRALVATGVALVALLAVGLGVAYALTDVPAPNEVVTAQSTRVLWAGSEEELGRLGALNRVDVRLDQVPQGVQEAVLSAEDRGFYSEPGISPAGIARAAWANLRGGEISQGGSTITQQYARNAYLTSERTFTRKAREIVLAVKLSRELSKEQVLEDYLNTVYFGRGAYGLQTAAETFFDTDVEDLTVEQAAVLAVQIRAPSTFDPAEDRQASERRWGLVLDGMVQEGWLSPGERADARYPEVAEVRGGDRLSGTEGYLLRQVEDELARVGFDAERLAGDGYVVETTLDARLQRFAEQAVTDVVGAEAPTVTTDDGEVPVLTPLVALDPRTGAVVAEVGGRDYVTTQFNAATQGRAPAGSAYKPVVLAQALSQGVSLRTRFSGASPRTFEFPGFRPYEARNYGGASYGTVDLVTATQNSVNTAYVALAAALGDLEAIQDMALRLGDIPEDSYGETVGLSLALGSGDVTAVQLAEVYGTFAAQGVHRQAHVVSEVRRPDGEVVYRFDTSGTEVLTPGVAADVTYALEQVVRRGTARGAGLPGRPEAGKTGTSSDNRSAWFAGYTPQLTTVVGLFTAGEPQPLRGVGGVRQVTGGSLPARTWEAFMSRALEGEEALDFPDPVFGGSTSIGRAARPSATASARPSRRPSAAPSRSASPSASAAPSSASPAPSQEETDDGGEDPGTAPSVEAPAPSAAPSARPPSPVPSPRRSTPPSPSPAGAGAAEGDGG